MKRSSWYRTACLFLCLFAVTAVFAASSPIGMLQSVSQRMLSYLHQHKSQLKSHPSLIYNMVNRILVPNVDMNRMSASVVGRNYWSKATSSQRSQFISQFKRLVTSTYAGALRSYDNDIVQFYPLRKAQGSYAQVRSVIVRKNGQRIPISYNCVNSGGRWKVYDFSIEGVSIVQNYRSQFAGPLARGGMSGLIADMKKEIAGVEYLEESLFVKESTIELSGAIDYRTIESWLKKVKGVLLETSSAELVVVDCSGVTDIDSSALALLLFVIRSAKNASQTLQLQSLPPVILELASLYRVTDIISTYIVN